MRQEDHAKQLAKELGMALRNMQGQVIGLFRPQYYPNNEYIPVIANEDGLLTCVQVGTLLGLSTLVIGMESGRYVQFPEYWNRVSGVPASECKQISTLTDMMQQPIEFDKWYRANVYDSNKQSNSNG